MKPATIFTNDGMSLFYEGEMHLIPSDHVNYEAIIECLNDEEYDRLNDLMNVGNAIEENFGDLTVNNGQVFYNGEMLHNVVTDRILRFMQEGLPYKPLVNFLKNLMENPSMRSRTQLYTFLENGGIPITDDGHFIAYKAIRGDWKDKHSATFDNSPGQVHEMDRSLVDDDPSNHCSNGFHVGIFSYADEFGSGHDDRMVLVKVNPRDAVSVPLDHNCQKLRVCRYEVIAEQQRRRELETAYIPSSTWDEEEESEDICSWDTYDDNYWGF